MNHDRMKLFVHLKKFVRKADGAPAASWVAPPGSASLKYVNKNCREVAAKICFRQ